MRSSTASTTSTGETSVALIIRASSRAGVQHSSSALIYPPLRSCWRHGSRNAPPRLTTLMRRWPTHDAERGPTMSTQQSAALDERAVDLAKLRTCLEQALVGLKVPESHAGPIAEVLLDAELRGYDDHGVYFLGELANWFRSGALNPAPNIRVLQETDAALTLDGDKGCGVVASFKAMRWCVERARSRGMASAGLRNSGHFVAAAPYPTEAARAGCIALVAANVTPLMPPPGGRSRKLGTNPLCFTAPTGGQFPVVFDMATSGIAGFKARVAALEGRSVPEGLIADAMGRPTTDPGEFTKGGLLLPVGGHK